jgi:hypothetical protein
VNPYSGNLDRIQIVKGWLDTPVSRPRTGSSWPFKRTCSTGRAWQVLKQWPKSLLQICCSSLLNVTVSENERRNWLSKKGLQLGPVGHEHPTLTPSKNAISEDGGAKSDARTAPNSIQDPDLARIVAVWPELPEHIKAAIKALIQTHITEIK